MMIEYIAHLADEDRLSTACGEPWQEWQAPKGLDNLPYDDPRSYVLPPMRYNPPRAHIDRIRQCQACVRVAFKWAGKNADSNQR